MMKAIKTQPHNQLIVVVSGPSGVGKDSVIRRMLQRDRNLMFAVTTNTRIMREGELEGKDYYFVSKREFEEMIKAGEFLEHALVYGDYKGVTKTSINRAIDSGRDVLLRVDVQGAATIKTIYKNAILFFLMSESNEQLLGRLEGRKSETSESMKERTATAVDEYTKKDIFDHIVVNRKNDLDSTVDIILEIINLERKRVL
ncbi:MAG: guanylate kinase [Anaerolineaceae bacterium]|nr:guanylate kinase [Anaerolineaceae bacterium]|tara:strand:- start:554 stop:1153 length:600 start_codon:yes stop_codon:yes gene_type:complete